MFSGLLVLGLVLLYFGAEWLVKGASQIALRCGIAPLVVGLTVVAFGTSAPELLVSIKANLAGQDDLAVGNVVGSNICNIGLILGVGALMVPLTIQRQVVRRELPILLGVSVIFAVMLWDGEVQRWEAGLLFVGIVVYLWSSFRMARKEAKEKGIVGTAEASDEISAEELAESQKGGAKKVALDVGLVLVGLVTLVFGADFLIKGGVGIARIFGVSEVIIGLTMVALGTSLPELAASVVAAMKGEGDLITGNALGSCLFNILAVIGISGMIAPLGAGELKVSDIAVMVGITLLAFVFMWSRRKLSRIEGGILLVVYLGYCAWLVI